MYKKCERGRVVAGSTWERFQEEEQQREFLKSNQVRSLEGATAQAQARDRRHGGRRRLD
jgi:hypothetical protein